jgi:hypothetical protein
MYRQKQSKDLKTAQNSKRFLPWVLVAIIIAVTAGLRFRFLDVPFERDEGEYAYAGRLMLQGIPPYSLVYNMKFPGIYAAYAFIMSVFGQTRAGVHFGLLIVNAVTILLVFLLVRSLIDTFTGVFAAAAFAVLSISKPVQGIFANAEHFILLFALSGLVLLLFSIDRKNLLLLLIASLLLGIGFIIKQHGIFFIVFAGLYLLFTQLRCKPFELKSFLLSIALFTVGVLLPFAVTCIILWQVGVFRKFWFWTFVYSREYVSITPVSIGLADLIYRLICIVDVTFLIWISAMVGLVTLFLKKNIRNQIPFVIGFSFLSFLAVCPGLYFRPHYFVLLMPAVALLAGVGLFGIWQILKGQKAAFEKDLAVAFLGLVIILHSLYLQKDYLLEEDNNTVARMTYNFNPFPESLKIAEFIKANSSSEDTIAILGSEPQILFYADRRSATSYIYMYPLTEQQPFALQMQKEMIQQIEAAKPRFLVYVRVITSWSLSPAYEKPLTDWFNQYYTQYYNVVGAVEIFPNSNAIYHWGQEAASCLPRTPHWIAIYQRNE